MGAYSGWHPSGLRVCVVMRTRACIQWFVLRERAETLCLRCLCLGVLRNGVSFSLFHMFVESCKDVGDHRTCDKLATAVLSRAVNFIGACSIGRTLCSLEISNAK